jgi:bifunctional N-acetylglucosamine-1-phosphate-uridyltransferase/glucosamine-1-phosphate-acetyltransferase GlmU-like protein
MAESPSIMLAGTVERVQPHKQPHDKDKTIVQVVLDDGAGYGRVVLPSDSRELAGIEVGLRVYLVITTVT